MEGEAESRSIARNLIKLNVNKYTVLLYIFVEKRDPFVENFKMIHVRHIKWTNWRNKFSVNL